VTNFVERLAVRRSDAVIGPSRLVVDRLEQLGWVRPEETWIVPLPVLGTAQDAISQPSVDTRWIVQVGRLEPGKAPELTLQAVRRLRERTADMDIRVAFLGASNGEWNGAQYDVALKQEAERLGVPCEVLGKVSREAVGEWLARTWLLAVPSLRDSGPLVALEAMSAGVPVVCSDACGVAAEIAEAGAGAVFPVGDVQACSDGLEALLGVEQRAAAGLAAVRLAHDVHDPEVVAGLRETVYRSVQRERSKPRSAN
jgi:glycosyltransferase involved in cell wall biosynthesis